VSDILVSTPGITDFLGLGDLQYENGELANYQSVYDPSYGRIKAKTHPAPGNHEYGTAGAAGYYQYFGAAAGDAAKGYYSFDIGTTWHVVALNSNCGTVSCAAGSAQEQWLRADLAASARPCTIAFWHHPRFSSGSTHGDTPSVAPLWDALAQDGAEVVLSGHEHVYERFAPQSPTGAPDANGVREFVVGTGGKSRYGFGTVKANSAARVQSFGVLELTLGSDSYTWQFVNDAGSVLDTGTGVCR
jgi:3',5'-cyclic AMP phosphodiesterase CpdA